MKVNRWQLRLHSDASVQRGAHRPIEHIQGSCYLDTVVGNNKIGGNKNEGESLAILIDMAMQR